jgi:hypothetical protein
MAVLAATAAAAGMGMFMRVVMPVLMRMLPAAAPALGLVLMLVVMLMMIVVVPVMVIVIMGVTMIVIADMHDRVRAERARHRARDATLRADDLGQMPIRRDEQRIGGNLDRMMMAADLPGGGKQPGRVLGRDLKELFRRGLHSDEPAILEPQRIAVIQRLALVERHRDGRAANGRHRAMQPLSGGMIEHQRVDDALGLDGGFADNRGGALHRELLQADLSGEIWWLARDLSSAAEAGLIRRKGWCRPDWTLPRGRIMLRR